MEEEAKRPVPWKVISAILLGAVVILAAFSAFQAVTRPEEFVPTCPENFGYDAGTRSCILTDTFTPTAVSSVDRGLAAAGEILTFDGGASTDDVGVTEWLWTFGDGTQATGKTVQKAYYVPGDYIVSLIVSDAAGNTATNEFSFTRVKVLNLPVSETNATAPLALLAVDGDVIEANQAVFADANGSWQWVWIGPGDAFTIMTGSEFLDIEYDFGDGATATGSNATHTYAKSGNYALRATVTGVNGVQSFSIHTVHVLAVPEEFVGEIKNPDSLITATIGDVAHLDPGRAYDSASLNVLRSIYEGLVFWDRDSLTDLNGMLATEVPSVANGLISADGLTYTFPIRTGVEFHNGDILTPEDVEYSFERNMISDFAGGPMWLILEPLAGVGGINADPMATNPLTDAELTALVTLVKDSVEVSGQNVVFTLQFPFPPFLGVLSGFGIYVMNKDYMINEKNQWPMTYDLATIREYNRAHDKYALHGDEPGDVMGTGPYTFKSWDPDVQVVLERFDDYWRAPAPMQFVVINNVPEWGTRKLLFLNGDVDFTFVPSVFREQVIGAPDIRLISPIDTLVMVYMGFNEIIDVTGGNTDLGTGVFDEDGDGTPDGVPANFFADEMVRRGFSWVMDYDTVITEIRKGLGFQPFGPIPKGLLGYTDQGPKYSLDMAKAEAAFKASTMWPTVWDEGFKFVLTYNEGNDVRRVASELLRDQLQALNPKFIIDIRPVPWGEFLDRLLLGRGTIYVVGWGPDYPDPHNFAHPFMRSEFGAFPIWTSYMNATVDAWIDQAGTELDPDVRIDLYAKIQEANFWDPPGIWLYQAQADHFERTWIQGWYYNDVTSSYWYDYSKG